MIGKRDRNGSQMLSRYIRLIKAQNKDIEHQIVFVIRLIHNQRCKLH